MKRFRLLSLLLLLYSSYLYAAPNGAALYKQQCSSCHQFVGKGGIGLPLSDSKLARITDNYLYKTIRLGRPGRIMPAFDELSDAQVFAIIKHVRHTSHTTSAKLEDIIISGNISKGQQLFAKNCTRCHGETGTGKGLGTGVTLSRERSFLVMPPAINNRGFLASVSDSMLFDTIKNGRTGTIMPTFAKLGLSDQDIHDVISYLRSFDTEPEQQKNLQVSHVMSSTADFATTVENVKQAVQGGNFRLFPDRYLEQGIADEFSVNKKQVGIRFCNFKQLYKMLRIEPRIGTALPCRITIMERPDGTVMLVAPNMRYIASLFNNEQLDQYSAIMDDAILDLLDTASM